MLKIRSFLEYKKCLACGQEMLVYRLRKVNKNESICENCRTGKSYSLRNNNYKGKQTNISYSFEFETSTKANSLYELGKYNFINCYDGTIGGFEWKSPIFNNRKSFHHVCRKLNKFAKYVGCSCGTHLHVSTPYKSILDEYKEEIFEPILSEMRDNKFKTVLFWGRYFNDYCRSNIGDTRYNSFNTRSSVQTLEFRLLKFVNAEQYIRAADFCIDTTRFLNNILSRDTFDTRIARKVGETILKKYKEVIRDV